MPAHPTPSVVGDFVLACGPDALTWIKKLDGFSVITAADEPAQVAVRGAAQHGRAADGTRFVAVADLIEGRVEDGTRALAGPTPQHDWRGRFAQVVWNTAER